MACQTLTVDLVQDARPQAGEICRAYDFTIAAADLIQTFAAEDMETFAADPLVQLS